MPGVCKKHPKYQEKIQFADCVADGLCFYFFLFLFLSWGMLHLGYVCLISGLMLGHCGLCRHHIGLMLGHFSGILWFVLAFVGQE